MSSRRRSGTAARRSSEKLQQWRRRGLGFCEGGGCGFGLGFQGGRGVAFIGAGAALACGPKGNAAGRAGSSRTLSLSPARSGEGDAPDRRGPPGGETGREGMALGRIGPGAGKRASARKMSRGKCFLGRLGKRKRDGPGKKIEEGFAFF